MGANLGVAAIMLYFGGTLGQFTDWPVSGYMAVILAAFVGACVILGLIIYFSAKVKNNGHALIIGIMIGYLASSVISILNYYSSTDRVHAFVMWEKDGYSCPLDPYTQISGIHLSQQQGIQRLYQQDSQQIGLAVPHISRLMLGSSNHKILVPITMLTGSCIALLCNLFL